MSGSDTAKKNSPDSAAAREAQSEIDDILNEVEAIRRELSGEPQITSSQSADSSEPSGTGGVTEPKISSDPAASPATEESDEDSEILKEFRESFIKTDVSEDLSDFDELTEVDASPGAEGAPGAARAVKERGARVDGLSEQDLEEDLAIEETLSALVPDDSMNALEELTAHSSDDSEADEGKSLLNQTLAHVAQGNRDESEAIVESSHSKGPEMATAEEERRGDVQPQVNGAAGALPGSLTLVLSGQMTLRLKYDFEGQEVTVSFAEGCLKVELADGTEFKIPVGKFKKPVRSAA